MALPAWYWPPSGLQARGNSIVPFSGGLAVPDWTTPQYFPFIGGAFLPPVVLATGALGIADACPDGASGMFAVEFNSRVWKIPASGAATSGLISATRVFMSAAMVGAGSGFFAASDGTVWSSAAVQIGSWPVPSIGLASSGSMMATLLPLSGRVATMTSAGVTGLITALPAALATGSCIAMGASSGIAVGGWQVAPALSGMAAAALDPQDSTAMLAVGSGRAIVWKTTVGAFSEQWAQTQILSGLANLSSMAWRPDGTQAFATSPVSGNVQVLGYTVGVLSLAQTLSVSGAVSSMIAGDSTHALVVQSGQSKIASFSFAASTWSSGTVFSGASVTGATAIAAFGATGAVVAISGGVTYMGLTAGTWSVLNTVALSYTPQKIVVDPFLRVITAGSGVMSVISGSSVIGSGSWAGSVPTDTVIHNNRYVVAIPSDGFYRIYSEINPGFWSQQSSGAIALGTPVGLGLSNTTLFMLGSGATNLWNFSGSPAIIQPVTSGVLALWNGASWTSFALGIGHNPSAITFDTSGNAVLVTKQNSIWSVTSGGVLNSSGALPVFPGQSQAAPLGSSDVLVASGHVYVSTSFAGVLVEPS